MTEKKTIKLAIIGVGVMGSSHVRFATELDNVDLVALCDVDKERVDLIADGLEGVEVYYDYKELLGKADVDGILIATPHYDHTPISIDAMNKGIHVLVEKPMAAHAKDATRTIEAYEEAKKTYPDLVFEAVFMQRTYGYWKKIKAMIDGGELGKLTRATWIITNWFRTQYYYDNGGWRATWKGEGGGVLLNQCPHNLDLYQWFVGMPKRVAGFASIGKYHNIEVEDEVTGYFEYENGMVGHFITTTAESPGTNRLEIVGELGKLVFEDGKLTFFKNSKSMLDQIEEAQHSFAKVENEEIEIEYDHHGESGHKMVIDNFANAILHGEELIAPAPEGIASVSLGNAIMLSSFLGRPVDMPLDEDAYEAQLMELIEKSTFVKNDLKADVSGDDFSKSFN